MCRISGIINPHLSSAELEHYAREMANIQAHGGPDDSGIYIGQQTNIALSHRRLSILDLSAAGHQPMSISGNNIWTSFNGEIYNFRILKNKLIKEGGQFTNETDTEVILQAYKHWGVASFKLLKGMFAFALFDETKQKTYLVR